MKKMMALALVMWVMLAMVGAQLARGEEQEYKHPGWECRDIAVLQQQLSLAKWDHQKITMTFLLDFAQNGEPATFADACTRIETAGNEINPSWTDALKADLKKQYAYGNKRFLQDLFVFAQANPTPYDFYLIIWGFRGYDPEWEYQRVANCMLNSQYPPNYALQAVEYLNRQAIALDKSDAEVLGMLKKLNRVFSALLTTDQAAWEKVVAQVRTLMETYE